MPLARVRRVLPLAWKRTFWEDFCLNGGAGIRVAVPSPKLLRSLPPAKRSAFRNRVIIALTANPYYALRGIRPGQRLPSSLRRVRSYRVGLNRWYLIASGSVDGLLKVRHGRVLEVGIADRRLMPRAITRR